MTDREKEETQMQDERNTEKLATLKLHRASLESMMRMQQRTKDDIDEVYDIQICELSARIDADNLAIKGLRK